MKLEIGNWQSAIRLRLSAYLLILFSIGWLGTQVGQSATVDNPYQAIVDRNVFGLVPIPTAPPPDPAAATKDLPKITPNGLMTIFGKLQVLFKVAVPGQPAGKEDAYVMSEGDRQDDIEVQKIDEKSAMITFNNHGIIQTLALVEGKASGGAPTGGAPGVPRLPNVPGHPPVPGAVTPAGFGGHFGRSRSPANGGDSSGTSANSGLGGSASSGANAQGDGAPLTPEAQVIMIEANRMLTQDAVNNGEMPPLPSTELTPPDATGIGGAPLIESSPETPNTGTPNTPGNP